MGPLDELRQKRLVRALARWRAPRARDESSCSRARPHGPTGSAARACWSGGAMPRRSGCSTSATSCISEDVDFCAALRARGRRIRFGRPSTVSTSAGSRDARRPRPPSGAYRRSHSRSTSKHHPGWAPLLRWYLRAKGRPGPDRLARTAPDGFGRQPDSIGPRMRIAHRRPETARLRHRHLRPEPAAPPRPARRASRSTSCSAGPTTADWFSDLGPELPRRAVARGAVLGRRTVHHSARGSLRERVAALPQPALRAAAAVAVPVGGDDPRLHSPDVSAVPAEPARARLRADVHVEGGARASARVLTVSEASKRDILRFFNIPEEKIIVIHNAHRRSLPARRRRTRRSSASASASSCTSRSCCTRATSSRTRTSSG